ncbi:MAG: T9SS type A sorting domain-containing protein, partial [Bacteroidia bacterium]|nr:T9SS type A sorting domain-containing protein [Bacteroidia bacterium]
PNNTNNDPHLGIDNVIVTAYADNVCNVILFNNDYKFKAIKNNSNYYFNWINPSQHNIRKYVIEHSADGKLFTPIDSIIFQSDSNEQLYMDRIVQKNFNEKISLFRLKAINDLQQIFYSKNVAINNYSINETINDSFYFYKYSEKENGTVYLKLNSPQQICLSIMDLSGITLFSETNNLLQKGNHQIVIPKLNTGVYILAVSGLADKTLYKKIIISE